MKRVLTALVLIPVALGLIFRAPPLFVRSALAAVGLLCLHEFYGLVRQRGVQPYAVAGMAAGALLILLPLSTFSAKGKSENGEANVTIFHNNGHDENFL